MHGSQGAPAPVQEGGRASHRRGGGRRGAQGRRDATRRCVATRKQDLITQSTNRTTRTWTFTSSSAWSRTRASGDIKRAYRRLARRFHPGHQPGRPRGGGALPADPRGVRDADRSGAASPLRLGRARAAPTTGASRSGFEGFDFSARGSRSAATFGDLFAECSGARRAARRRRARRRPAPRRCAVVRRGVERRERTVTVTRAGAVRRLRGRRLSRA